MRGKFYGKEDTERFVKAWAIASCLEEVASQMGITKSACSMRAAKLRAAGVRLKRMGGFRVNVGELNALIADAE